jgi:hypothetical protein
MPKVKEDMMYKLKPGAESFEVVDGPMAGRKFLRGMSYDKIPPEEKDKFIELKAQSSSLKSEKPQDQKVGKSEDQKVGDTEK